MSTEEKEIQPIETVEPSETVEAQPVVKDSPTSKGSQTRGGFMNGGLPMTFLFLLAFFLISFYAGVLSERNNKLVTNGTGSVQSATKFNVDNFKKVASDLKLDTKKFNSCLDTGKYADAVKKDQQEGVDLKITGTPTFLVNGTALVGAHPLATFESALDNGTFPVDPEGSASGTLADGQKISKTIPVDEKERIKGDRNAKITIIEYSDFECPFCARFYSQTYKQIEDKYLKTGKAKLVYKDFPLTSLHPNAVKAAEAARCAQEQGKFWEMHDKLFELQMSSS